MFKMFKNSINLNILNISIEKKNKLSMVSKNHEI